MGRGDKGSLKDQSVTLVQNIPSIPAPRQVLREPLTEGVKHNIHLGLISADADSRTMAVKELEFHFNGGADITPLLRPISRVLAEDRRFTLQLLGLAVRLAGENTKVAQFVPVIGDLLHDEKEEVRYLALRFFRKYAAHGSQMGSYLSPIIACLADTNVLNGEVALATLRTYVSKGPGEAYALKDALPDKFKDPYDRFADLSAACNAILAGVGK